MFLVLMINVKIQKKESSLKRKESKIYKDIPVIHPITIFTISVSKKEIHIKTIPPIMKESIKLGNTSLTCNFKVKSIRELV